MANGASPPANGAAGAVNGAAADAERSSLTSTSSGGLGSPVSLTSNGSGGNGTQSELNGALDMGASFLVVYHRKMVRKNMHPGIVPDSLRFFPLLVFVDPARSLLRVAAQDKTQSVRSAVAGPTVVGYGCGRRRG